MMTEMGGPGPDGWCPPRRGRWTDTEERTDMEGGLEPPGARRSGEGPSVDPPEGARSGPQTLASVREGRDSCCPSPVRGLPLPKPQDTPTGVWGCGGDGQPFWGAGLLYPLPSGTKSGSTLQQAGLPQRRPRWAEGEAVGRLGPLGPAVMPAGLSGKQEGVRGGRPAAPSLPPARLLGGPEQAHGPHSPGRELHPGFPPPGAEGVRAETGSRERGRTGCAEPRGETGWARRPPFFSEAQTVSLPQGFVLAVRGPCGGPRLGAAGEVLAGGHRVPERPARAGSL